jgi:hypothetical protein
MAINWEGFNAGIGDIGSGLAQYAREQRARQLALEDYKMKQQSELDQAIALAKAQAEIKNQFLDPSDILSRFKVGQEIDALQQKQNFNRRAEIGFGNAMPSEAEIIPVTPSNFSPSFQRTLITKSLQFPNSPTSLVNKLRGSIRSPFDRAGETLIPSEKGWESKKKVGMMGDEQGKEYFNRAFKLRGQFDDLSKDFRKVRDSYGRILASANDPSAAGDLALIFNYMKVLDPGSTVREGEFATAQNSAGIPDQIRNIYNKAMTGKRLAPDQRIDFVNRAKKLYQAQADIQSKSIKQYTDLASRAQVKPEDVITDLYDLMGDNIAYGSSSVASGRSNDNDPLGLR